MNVRRVLFDSQDIERQALGGITRYFSHLARNLKRETAYRPIEFPRFVPRNLPSYEPGIGPLLPTREVRRRTVQANHKLESKFNPHIVHSTYYEPRFLAAIAESDAKHVVTIHDMIPESHPEYFLGGGNPHLAKRSYVDDADLVVVVSEFSKQELFRHYGDLRALVEVVPLAAFMESTSTSNQSVYDPGYPYFLYVGARGGYKNFVLVLKALQHASESIRVIAVGGGEFNEEERAWMNDWDVTHRVTRVDASDKKLISLYRGATGVVIPSVLEGFGLPLLEAMTLGTPCVASNRGPLPDVGVDACVYFDPFDEHALSELLIRVAQDNELRAALSRNGLVRARDFSWRKTAQLTASAYDQLF